MVVGCMERVERVERIGEGAGSPWERGVGWGYRPLKGLQLKPKPNGSIASKRYAPRQISTKMMRL